MMLQKKRIDRISFAEILFYALILSMPFDQLVMFYGYSIMKLLGVLWILFSLSEIKKFYGRMPVEFVYFIIYIGIGVTIDIYLFPFTSIYINENVRPVLFLILMLAAYNLALFGRSKLIITCLVLSSLLLTLFQDTSLMSSNTRHFEEVSGYGERIAALATDPNFTACYIALGVVVNVMYLFQVVKSPKWLRILSGFLIVVGVSGILKTMSRGGILALFVGLGAVYFTRRQVSKKLLVFVGISVVLGGIYFGVMQNYTLVDRFARYAERGDMSGRDVIWHEARRLIKQKPCFGYGYRMHLFELGKAMNSDMKGTHNTYIASFLASGVIGGFFFCLMLICAGLAAWQRRNSFPGNILFCWFIICTVAGMSLNVEIAKWFWLVLALCLAQKKLQENNNPPHPVGCDSL